MPDAPVATPAPTWPEPAPNHLVALFEKAIDFISDLTPAATAIGGPIVGNALSVVNAVAEIGRNIMERVDDNKVALSSDDQATIRALIAKVADTNNALAAAVSAS